MRETFVHMISVHAPQLFGLFCISGCWKNHADPNFRKHVAAGLKRSQRKRMVECLGGLYGFRQHMSHQPGEHEPAFVAALWWGTHTPTTWKKNVSSYAQPMFHTKYPRKKPQATQVFFSNVAIDWLWPYSLIKCCQENYQAANLWSVMRGQSHPLQPLSEAICIARLPAFNCVQQNLRWWCYKLCHPWIKSLLPFPALSLTGFCNSILNAKIKWEEVL